jgi:hypothetical protein
MADFRLGRLKFNWRGAWTPNTTYVIDDIVKVGANTYVCVENHTSTTAESVWLATDASKWSLHAEGVNHRGDWTGSTFYNKNDIVKYGNTQYRVVNSFTSTSVFDSSNMVAYVGGVDYEGLWQSGTSYQVGDIVSFHGYTYIAVTNNSSKNPAEYAIDWEVLATGFDFVGAYTTTTQYYPGDVVRFGGYSYVSIASTINTNPLDINSWDLIVKGFEWKGAWSSITSYQLGDSVSSGSNSYVSVASSNFNQDPGEDSLGTYWNPLTQGAETNVLSITGDLVYQSGAGPARLPIGQDGQVLTVSPGGVPQWEKNNVTHPVYYVTEEGSDSNDGLSISRSFASVRHACGIATGPATIYIKAGVYRETLPITVPEEVSIVGDNLRTSKVRPDTGNADYQEIVVNTAPNTVTYGSTIGNFDNTKVAKVLYSTYDEKRIHIQPISGGAWTTSDQWNDGGTGISISSVETRTNAEATMFLLSDKTMLKDIVMEGMTGFQPAGIVTTISGTISGTVLQSNNLFPDLVGTTVSGAGVSAGTVVVNVTNSSVAEVSITQNVGPVDLTYTAPAYDLNNSTIKGVFVALNPSSKITKSPYVSNCSSFSSGGMGVIVDGRVHRQFENDPLPSNKSMVFDSWTNINDDGVGYWVTNNAAAELVSCFTYYAHVSYCSTRGARIRSLAGNSSWGEYAIVSSGFNTEESFLEGNIEGLVLSYKLSSVSLPGFSIGERVRGTTSGAIGLINNIQDSAGELYYSLITAGPGGTGFASDELIEGIGTGTTALTLNNTDASKGQNGFILVCAGLTTAATDGGSMEFVTGDGTGNAGDKTTTGAEPFTFVIQSTSYTGPDGRGTIGIARSELNSVAAGHTGGTTLIYKYPHTTTTTTVTQAVQPSDTQLKVNSIAGFFPNGYVLSSGNELMQIQSFPDGTTINVTRAQEGAAGAQSYNNGDTIRSVGIKTTISGEIFKDFTGISTSMRVFSTTGGWVVNDWIKIDSEFMKINSIAQDQEGLTTIILAEEKGTETFDEQQFKIRYLYSQVRLTGHDFLQIGTGGTSTTNWPNLPLVDPIQSREITEGFPGRVYYVSTDQDGNFRVGRYFRVNQSTGSATLNASAFDLSGLQSLRLGSIGAQLGASINEFATDPNMTANSNDKVPTQAAVKAYVDNSIENEDALLRTFTYFMSSR